jgi:hypothetical protein
MGSCLKLWSWSSPGTTLALRALRGCLDFAEGASSNSGKIWCLMRVEVLYTSGTTVLASVVVCCNLQLVPPPPLGFGRHSLQTPHRRASSDEKPPRPKQGRAVRRQLPFLFSPTCKLSKLFRHPYHRH